MGPAAPPPRKEEPPGSEHELRSALARLHTVTRARTIMAECNRALIRAASEDQLFKEMCRIVAGPGGYNLAWVGLVEDDEEKTVRPVAHVSRAGPDFSQARFSWGENQYGLGPTGRAVRSGTAQVVRHATSDPHFAAWRGSGSHGIKSTAAFPLKVDGKVVAVFGINTTAEHAFDPNEMTLLDELAADIAYGISALRTRELRRLAEEQTAQAERLFHATFDTAPIGINLVSRDGRIMFANPFLERLFGYEPGQLAGRHMRELRLPEDIEEATKVVSLIDALYERRLDRFTRELRCRRKDGSVVWMEMTVSLMHDSDGKPAYQLATMADISERKHAEATLRESEARYRNLTELSADFYWEEDEQYRLTHVARYSSIQLTPERPLRNLGKAPWEMDFVNMAEADWAAHRAKLDARESFRDLVLKRVRPDGTVLWLSASGYPAFDSSGNFTGYRGITREITRQVRAGEIRRLEHKVTRCLAEADAALDALVQVMRVMCEALHWTCGRYFQVDSESRILRMTAHWGNGDAVVARYLQQSRELAITPGMGLSGKVWQSGQPMWSRDKATDPRRTEIAGVATLHAAHEAGLHASFVFPVISEGEVLGVMALSSQNIRDPDDRLLAAVRVIGSQIGQFLRRKQGEDRIRTQAEFQRLISEFCQQTLASNDFGAVMQQAVSLVAGTLQADRCEIMRVDAAARRGTCMAASGWPEDWPGFKGVEVAEDGVFAHINSRQEPLVVADYSRHAQLRFGKLLEWGVHSGMMMPITAGTGTFGVFSVHSARVRRFSEDEARFLYSIANILAVAIQRNNAEDKLAYLAQFDSLTGLPNRHLFHDRLGQSMAQAKRSGAPMAVLFIDLDRFKLINDTLGHAIGDKLLIEAAGRLQESVRASDTVGRLGGDEFGAILQALAKPGDAGVVSQKIIDALAKPFNIAGYEAYVSASVGITLYPDDGEEAGVLVMNADTAMYRAKEQGRHNYQYFTRQMNERALQRLNMEAELRRALERKEFILHYQPRVSLKDGAIRGFEALLRWNHPEGGIVLPMQFIPVLEETGLIVPVGEWVITEACRQMAAWQRAGLDVPPVAVNLSTRQFQQKDLSVSVVRILQESGIPASLLQFEITESLLMDDPDSAVTMLSALSTAGVKLSVDDFGTGYSSLSYLKRFPLDALKIDQAFVRDVTTDADDAAITLAIINLAHILGLEVIAEGVENEGQLAFLHVHSCDEIQGYYFSRPMPAEDCAEMLARGRRLQAPFFD